MPCEDLIASCFSDPAAPFALDPTDRDNALRYLHCCYESGLSWQDAHQQVEAYLRGKGLTEAQVATQIVIARQMFHPWLD
jgi:hypothetical protein